MGTNIAKRMVFGAVLVCIMITIVACGSTKEKSDLILGNWTEEKSGIWICFRADGLAEMGLGVGENLAEESLYWSIQGDEMDGDTDTFVVRIVDNNHLELTDAEYEDDSTDLYRVDAQGRRIYGE